MAIFLEMRAVERDGDTRLNRGYYDVFHEGEHLCRSSEPFLAGCRELLARGHSAGAIVEIRRAGQAGYSLRGRLGHAAGLAVREDGRRGPEFGPYKPYSRAEASPPMRFSDEEVPGQPPTPKIAPRRHRGAGGAYRREDLHWDGNRLFLGRRPEPLLEIVADDQYPAMWRVRRWDGRLSEMVNLTRARDAAEQIGLSVMNGEPGHA
jgi:hypothetical protein